MVASSPTAIRFSSGSSSVRSNRDAGGSLWPKSKTGRDPDSDVIVEASLPAFVESGELENEGRHSSRPSSSTSSETALVDIRQLPDQDHDNDDERDRFIEILDLTCRGAKVSISRQIAPPPKPKTITTTVTPTAVNTPVVTVTDLTTYDDLNWFEKWLIPEPDPDVIVAAMAADALHKKAMSVASGRQLEPQEERFTTPSPPVVESEKIINVTGYSDLPNQHELVHETPVDGTALPDRSVAPSTPQQETEGAMVVHQHDTSFTDTFAWLASFIDPLPPGTQYQPPEDDTISLSLFSCQVPDTRLFLDGVLTQPQLQLPTIDSLTAVAPEGGTTSYELSYRQNSMVSGAAVNRSQTMEITESFSPNRDRSLSPSRTQEYAPLSPTGSSNVPEPTMSSIPVAAGEALAHSSSPGISAADACPAACIDPVAVDPSAKEEATGNATSETSKELPCKTASGTPDVSTDRVHSDKLPINPTNDEDDDKAKLFSDLNSLPSARGDKSINSKLSVKSADLTNLSTAKKADRIGETRTSSGDVGDRGASVRSHGATDFDLSDLDAIESIGNDSSDARRKLLILELRTVIASHGRHDIRVAAISASLGDLLHESRHFSQAIQLHREAVSIYSNQLGDNSSRTLDAKTRLGEVLEDAGEYDEAINTYYVVMMMRRALDGDSDPAAADALVRMANTLRRKGDYNQAIKELKRALKIYRESLGDSHVKVSKTVDEIASLYVTLGDFEKSAAILEEVVKLKAATMGVKHHSVALALISLATTYECSEEFEKAMKALKKAYKIYTEIGGYSSEDSTATLNRIALLYEATGDHNRASIAYLGVLRGRKINLGDDHLMVGETYFELGRTLRESGQSEKALKCMKEALPIFVGNGVELHDVEMIAAVMHEMAMIFKEKKNFKEAARIFRQELAVRRKIGQSEYPMVARTLNYMGVAEYELQNYSKALKYLVEALTIYQARGEKGVDCAEVLFNTGLVFEAVVNKDRALEAFTEAARIFKARGYSVDHPHLKKANYKVTKLSKDRK